MPGMTLLRLSPEKFIEFPSAKLQSVSVNLNLKNETERAVAYKIKTTAPKNYLVRPSSGIIAPGEEQDVQIVLQPQQSFPENCSDRFLVQATEVENTSVQLTKDFWTSVPKQLLQDQRLSVVFKREEGTAAAPATVGGGAAAVSSIAASPAPFSTAIGLDASDIRRPAGPPPIGGSSDFEVKYNELLQYCLALEKQKTVLSNELIGSRQQNETLNQRIGTSLCRTCGGKLDIPSSSSTVNPAASGYSTGPQQGFQLWQVIAMIIFVVMASKLFNLL